MTQKLRIEALKEELRESTKNNKTGKVITKKRMLTYISLFGLTPYGLYRLWASDSGFSSGEKVFLSLVSVVYLVTLIKRI